MQKLYKVVSASHLRAKKSNTVIASKAELNGVLLNFTRDVLMDGGAEGNQNLSTKRKRFGVRVLATLGFSITKRRQKPPFCYGGAEGNRTPVRKPLDTTFSGCRVSFTLFAARAGTQARSSSNRFLRDRFNGKPPMHVHHFHDVQSRFVVLPRGTGDPQVTALPIIEPRGVNN